MDNIIVNGHLFIINIKDGKVSLVLKKDNNKLSIPKINYLGKDSIDLSIKRYLKEDVKVSDLSITSCHVFSKNNVIDIIYAVITKDTNLNDGYKYYEIKDLDRKLVSNHVMSYLKDNMKKVAFLKNIYDECFSLRELQDIVESIYDIKLDRRNFRKRLLNLNIISETDDIRKKTSNGRPNKLYKFNETKEETLI